MAAKLPTSRIDRTSPVPFYFQLKKTLAEEILAGNVADGDTVEVGAGKDGLTLKAAKSTAKAA